MDEKLSQNKDLRVEIKDEEIKNLKQDLKNINWGVQQNIDSRLRKSLQLIKMPSKTEKQQKELAGLLDPMVYAFMLDNGTLLTSIPNKQEKQYGLLAIRQRLIEEHNCKSAAELILVDQIAAAYWRLMKYEMYASKLPEKEEGWSFDQLKVNVLKEVRQSIEQANRQIIMSLTMLKDLKQPQLRVNVKAGSAYFAQNQQVINENPEEKAPVETIKPK